MYKAYREAWSCGVFEPPKPNLKAANGCTVSVILCTYNRPNRLRQALESVLAQTYQDYEVLVINDGGDPVAENVVRQCDSPKVRYLCCEHGGHRVAMNHGIRVAQGKYIAYLDDDDVYYPDHLASLVAAAEKDSLNFVCSRNRWVQGHWENDEWTSDYELTHQDTGLQIERMRVSAYVPDATVLHRRAIVNQIGLFFEEPQRGGEWEFWVRCSRHYPIRRIDDVTCECRVQTASLPLSQPARARLFTELWRMYFGSEFGEAVLALGAIQNNDRAMWQESVRSLIEHYVFLRPDLYRKIWWMAVEEGSKISKALLTRMSEANPVAFAQAWFSRKSSRSAWREYLSFPNASLKPLIKYVLCHPGYLLDRLSRKLRNAG